MDYVALVSFVCLFQVDSAIDKKSGPLNRVTIPPTNYDFPTKHDFQAFSPPLSDIFSQISGIFSASCIDFGQ